MPTPGRPKVPLASFHCKESRPVDLRRRPSTSHRPDYAVALPCRRSAGLRRLGTKNGILFSCAEVAIRSFLRRACLSAKRPRHRTLRATTFSAYMRGVNLRASSHSTLIPVFRLASRITGNPPTTPGRRRHAHIAIASATIIPVSAEHPIPYAGEVTVAARCGGVACRPRQ